MEAVREQENFLKTMDSVREKLDILLQTSSDSLIVKYSSNGHRKVSIKKLLEQLEKLKKKK